MSWKSALSILIAGLTVGFCSVIFHGYLSAIAIPRAYFIWFKENLNVGSGLILLGCIQQFLALELMTFITSYLIVRYLRLHWLITAAGFYLSVWFYFIVGMALIYDMQIILPRFEFSVYSIEHIVPFILLGLGTKLGLLKRHAQEAQG